MNLKKILQNNFSNLRIEYFSKLTGLSQKELKYKFENENLTEKQSTKIEFLYNNNINFYNENKKIFNGKKINYKNFDLLNEIKNKIYNQYIIQFHNFPLKNLKTNQILKLFNFTHFDEKHKELIIKNYRINIINFQKLYNEVKDEIDLIKIQKYLTNKNLNNKLCLFSCLFCNKKKIKKLKQLYDKNKSSLEMFQNKNKNLKLNDNTDEINSMIKLKDLNFSNSNNQSLNIKSINPNSKNNNNINIKTYKNFFNIAINTNNSNNNNNNDCISENLNIKNNKLNSNQNPTNDKLLLKVNTHINKKNSENLISNINPNQIYSIKKSISVNYNNSTTNNSLLNDNKINDINQDLIINNNIYEQINFPFTNEGKLVTFFLSSDIIKSLLFIKKSSNAEYVLHSFSFITNKNAFFHDFYFQEINLRSNFEKLIKNKNIIFPLILNGNVFFPNLIFFRGDEDLNFKILKNPIITPLIISQLLPENFPLNFNNIVDINNKIIEENLEISHELFFDQIIINLIPVSDNSLLFSIIKMYIENIKKNINYRIKSIAFLINISDDQIANEEQFKNFILTSDIQFILDDENFKSKIITL
jgi:hypothetical protein